MGESMPVLLHTSSGRDGRFITMLTAVPWLRMLVAGLSPRESGSVPGQSMWDLWWTKRHWNRFCSKYFGFPLSVPFHRGYLSFIRLSPTLY